MDGPSAAGSVYERKEEYRCSKSRSGFVGGRNGTFIECAVLVEAALVVVPVGPEGPPDLPGSGSGTSDF